MAKAVWRFSYGTSMSDSIFGIPCNFCSGVKVKALSSNSVGLRAPCGCGTPLARTSTGSHPITAMPAVTPRPLTRPQKIARLSPHDRHEAALAAFIRRNHFQYHDAVYDAAPEWRYPSDFMLEPLMIAYRTLKVPHPHEVAACCANVSGVVAFRSPQCFMWREHCRSLVHVAALFGVPAAELRRAVRTWKKLAEAASVLAPLAS